MLTIPRGWRDVLLEKGPEGFAKAKAKTQAVAADGHDFP